MLLALRAFREALTEFFFDLPRMVLLNLFWFVTALPAIFVAFGVAQMLATFESWQQLVLNIWLVPVIALALALAGPGTAAIYAVTNRLANGELLEITRFWRHFRQYFWRGWALAVLNVAAGALLVLNVAFYWTSAGPTLRVLSVVFLWLLAMWFAIQGYLFALLVELDQSIRLVVRNAVFLALDNLGLTFGLALVNALLLLVSVPPWSALLVLPLASMSITSNLHNKVIVAAVRRYRGEGRIFRDERDERTDQ
jgi:uncharacterized membrane protein YesL